MNLIEVVTNASKQKGSFARQFWIDEGLPWAISEHPYFPLQIVKDGRIDEGHSAWHPCVDDVLANGWVNLESMQETSKSAVGSSDGKAGMSLLEATKIAFAGNNYISRKIWQDNDYPFKILPTNSFPGFITKGVKTWAHWNLEAEDILATDWVVLDR